MSELEMIPANGKCPDGIDGKFVIFFAKFSFAFIVTIHFSTPSVKLIGVITIYLFVVFYVFFACFLCVFQAFPVFAFCCKNTYFHDLF